MAQGVMKMPNIAGKDLFSMLKKIVDPCYTGIPPEVPASHIEC